MLETIALDLSKPRLGLAGLLAAGFESGLGADGVSDKGRTHRPGGLTSSASERGKNLLAIVLSYSGISNAGLKTASALRRQTRRTKSPRQALDLGLRTVRKGLKKISLTIIKMLFFCLSHITPSFSIAPGK